MGDPTSMAILSLAALAGIGVASAAALQAWRGWLDLCRCRISTAPGPEAPPGSASARIEIADLRERVRNLEAIANGVSR